MSASDRLLGAVQLQERPAAPSSNTPGPGPESKRARMPAGRRRQMRER